MSVRNISNYLSNKIKHVMFAMSLFVVYIHMYDGTVISQGDLYNRIQDIVSQGICRCAVPLFFIISGFLTFSVQNINERILLKQIPKRMKTLGIPFLFWNIFYFLFFTFINWLMSILNNLQFTISLSITDILKIVFLYSNNAPFWYVFQLIILTVLTPLLFYVYRKKYIGISFVVLMFTLYLLISENSDLLLLPGIVFFSIGAITALHFSDIAGKRCSKICGISALTLFVVFTVLRFIFADLSVTAQEYRHMIIRKLYEFVITILIWLVFDLFDIGNKKVYSIENKSFMVYALHIAFITVIQALLSKLKLNVILNIVAYMLVPIIITMIISLISMFIKKRIPILCKLITGGR